MNRRPLKRKISYIVTEVSNSKAFFLLVLIIVLSIILLIRLFYLQIRQKDHYVSLSENNYVRTVMIEAPRGTIYDRNGIVLAEDIPSFHMVVSYQQWAQNDLAQLEGQDKESITLLSRTLSLSEKSILDKILESRENQSDIIIKSNLSDQEYASIVENLDKMQGFYIKRGFKRHYPQGQVLCHTIGYTQIARKEDMEFFGNQLNIDWNDRVGQTGIERFYEAILRGEKGSIHQKIDALGNVLDETETKSIQKGNDIYLTVDVTLQKKLESLIQKHVGTMMMMDCQTGEILASASNPGFDPNLFSSVLPEKTWNEMLEKRSLFNIAVQGQYPPGSIFKPLVSLFGLTHQLIREKDQLLCGGKIDVEGLEGKYRCWVYPSQHGWLSMQEALQYSCDIYFFELIRKYDIRSFLDFVRMYGGISQKTNVDLPEEAEGTLHDPEWKKKFVGYEWFEGDSMNLGIGQGYLAVTPVQMLQVYANIASDGKTPLPHFFLKTKGKKDFSPSFIKPKKEIISTKFYQFIRESLYRVTQPGGTAPLLQNTKVNIAAKTGTAEDAPDIHGKPTQDLWLAGFAPYQKPEIAALVMFEKSTLEFGGDLSPIFKEGILYYFENKNNIIGVR